MTSTTNKASTARALISLLLCTAFGLDVAIAQSPKTSAPTRTIIPNQPAPELYANKLSLRITLMNLPGAAESQSYWEGEFQIYFVAERDFEKIMRQLAKEGKNRDLKPDYFPNKILLGKGNFSGKKLTTLPERTILRPGIEFKSKIPTDEQTSFSSILSFYSVKVHDAKLKKDVFGSSVFIVPPFDNEANVQDAPSARTDLYLNFYVSDDGSLFKSNRKRASQMTEWKP